MANNDIERDGGRNHNPNDSSSINSIQELSEETSLLSSNTKKDDYQSTDVSIGDSSSTEDETPQNFRNPVGIIALLLIGKPTTF
jgi:hypothetical protein